MARTIDIRLTVNGERFDLAVEARLTLIDALRDACGKTGTHAGCEHGVCGACTILLDDVPVRSCLLLAVQANGRAVRTVEGLARDGRLHPLQRAFMEHHGLQCGFCTPGFLMLAVGVLESDPEISDGDLLDAMSSNLCRCTGYQTIMTAIRAAAAEMRSSPPLSPERTVPNAAS